MSKKKTPIIQFDGERVSKFMVFWVRCWKEKRQFVVQVWKMESSGASQELDFAHPDYEWVMPGVLGREASISQALLQSCD